MVEREIKEDLVCEFCNKKFVQHKSFINHTCKKKQRWFRQNEPENRFGFLAWNRFYQLNSYNKTEQWKNSYKNFIDSRYYESFVKFGKHIRDINAINPKKFIDYVIKNTIPIDRWTQDYIYEQYVRELTRQETGEDALERNILLMNEWSMSTGENWFDFFRMVNPNQGTLWIKSGRISPWVLYNADSSVDFLERCSPEQLSIIKDCAPPGPWKIKFSKNRETCTFIRNTLRESGI